MSVSVIIPNFNYAHFLAGAIESALNQTHPPLEVLVVDDGSTDGSREVASRYDGRVRWIAQTNQGVSVARNRGAAESRGSFIAFLDADDVWHPNKLKQQLAVMEDPAIGLAVCGIEFMDAAGLSLGETLSGTSGRVLKEIVLLRWPGSPGLGSTALIRKRIFEEAGGFDAGLSTSADWDLWRRIASRHACGMVHEPLVRYRLHGNSMHAKVDIFERDMTRAMARVFSDPASSAVFDLRRQAFGNLYLMLSGSYFQAGRLGKSAAFALRSFMQWPPHLGYVAAFPLRRLKRNRRVRIGDDSSHIVLANRPGVLKHG